MAFRTRRALNKRKLKQQVSILERAGNAVAMVAQDYQGVGYEKYDQAFQTVYTTIELAKAAVDRLSNMV